jgi:hypothetical protein
MTGGSRGVQSGGTAIRTSVFGSAQGPTASEFLAKVVLSAIA